MERKSTSDLAAVVASIPTAKHAEVGGDFPVDGTYIAPGTETLIRRLLGRGGYGSVWQGTHATYGEVALKVIHLHLARKTEIVDRFLRENEILKYIKHPNIVRVYGSGYTADEFRAYIILEYLDGMGGRAALTNKGRLAINHALEILSDVGSALVELHRMKIVHGDVKPDNIYIAIEDTGKAVPKLIDFGVYKHFSSGKDGAKVTVEGTLFYIAPECLLGQDAGPAGDVYSFGVLAYELITGVRPTHKFEEKEAEFRRQSGAMNVEPPNFVRNAVLNQEAPRLSEHLQAPAGVERIVARCLAKDPNRRPTMSEVVHQLRVEYEQLDAMFISSHESTQEILTGNVRAVNPESIKRAAARARVRRRDITTDEPTTVSSDAPRPVSIRRSIQFGVFSALALVVLFCGVYGVARFVQARDVARSASSSPSAPEGDAPAPSQATAESPAPPAPAAVPPAPSASTAALPAPASEALSAKTSSASSPPKGKAGQTTTRPATTNVANGRPAQELDRLDESDGIKPTPDPPKRKRSSSKKNGDEYSGWMEK